MKINKNDKIDGDKIVIFDKDKNGPYTLRKVEIITPTGKKVYEIKKTRKGGYLFNWTTRQASQYSKLASKPGDLQ